MTSEDNKSQPRDEADMLLPTLIDERAQSDPNKLFCALLKSGDVKDGITMVTYHDYTNAINKCAWWIENSLGKGENFETLAYLGPPDIRYTIVSLAASKTSHKAMLMSHQNSFEGQLKLLDVTHCTVLLTAKDSPAFDPLVSLLSSKRPLKVFQIESIDYWLEKEKVPNYPFEGTFEKDSDRPFAVLHTSGSTGLPEPIVYTFGALTAYRTWLDPEKLVPGAPRATVDKWKDICHYIAFPPSHMTGLLLVTALNVYWNMPPILAPGDVVWTPALINSIHQLDLCGASVLPPSFLMELAKRQEYLDGFRKLDHIIWCGSAFSSSAVSTKISSYVPIYAAYGASEAGPLPLTLESQEDHEYMTFSPLVGAEFRHHIDDLYELVIVKDAKLKASQKVFFIFPELSEWPSKDLMSKHPTKDGMWRYRGRKDDILVLLSGRNVNPPLMEGIVMSHPKVVSALLTGTGRLETAWLIEAVDPPQNFEETFALSDEMWPILEKANEAGILPARVSKDKIVFTSRQKPMLRAGKGTVQRQLTIDAYQAELDALYQ